MNDSLQFEIIDAGFISKDSYQIKIEFYNPLRFVVVNLNYSHNKQLF